ncbi:uncharacterized protein B0I36DRAFT_330366 [Microdochium trichocladiopsis]|uniref:DUF159 domain protein n=1 Tax=Microdochium trichocladiopsis TaxID=1682393 RepID=A0A9P8Y063_9PEZI|nr:uncharacterized protein B0I36DRAFT_330366 [Microdochium trichocladiopsis]KAH7026313.1 hypothetical protein B0I36DRAFT_330366 [Microdochium trichocladiopsis]
MCGRYALALRPGQIRQRLEDDNMPVYQGIDDDNDSTDAPGAPRQSYNFAPGYHGVVYRAEVPDWGAGPQRRGGRGGRDGGGEDGHDDDGEPRDSEHQQHDPSAVNEDNSSHDGGGDKEVRYKMQSMKWGLVPFWTKRNPDYGSMLKTINCRDDSLAQAGGMWATMKARKRCIVIAQGFYEWLKKEGVKDKIPHYIRRKDGKLMCMAGLWDMVQYEDDDYKHYTYTIITTDSNKQLGFLHDRMPVILENGSDEVRTWLDPARHEWSAELQSLLRPWKGELEIYPVSKDVGKVGNNSPTFIIPIDSKENKNNIANFFTSKAAAAAAGGGGQKQKQKQAMENNKESDTARGKEKMAKAEEGRQGGVAPGKSKPGEERQPEIEMTQDKGFIAKDEDEDEDNDSQAAAAATPIKQEASSQSNIPPTTTTTATSLKRPAPNDEHDEPPPPALKKEKLELEETSPSRMMTMMTTRSSGGSKKPMPSPSPRKHTTTTTASAPGKSAAGRPKISATSNGTKAPPVKGKNGKNQGAQKITKFFGNSA